MGVNCASDAAKNVLFALNIVDGTMAAVYAAPRAPATTLGLPSPRGENGASCRREPRSR